MTGRTIKLGLGHKDTLDATGKLADVMAAQGQAKDGKALYEAAKARYEAANGPAEDDAAKAHGTKEGAPPPPVALGIGLNGTGQEESKGADGDEGGGDAGGGGEADGESDMEDEVASLDPEDYYHSDEDTDEEDEAVGVIAGCMCVPTTSTRKKGKQQKLIRRNYVAGDGSIRFEMVKVLHKPEEELMMVAQLGERWWRCACVYVCVLGVGVGALVDPTYPHATLQPHAPPCNLATPRTPTQPHATSRNLTHAPRTPPRNPTHPHATPRTRAQTSGRTLSRRARWCTWSTSNGSPPGSSSHPAATERRLQSTTRGSSGASRAR